MIDDKADELIKKLLQSLIYRYQTGLETSVKCTDFITNVII